MPIEGWKKGGMEEIDVKAGDDFLFIVKGRVTVLMPKPKKYSETLAGKGKGLYPKDYLEKERQSW